MSRDCVSIVWVCTCVGVFHMCKTAVLKYTLCSSRQVPQATSAKRGANIRRKVAKERVKLATLLYLIPGFEENPPTCLVRPTLPPYEPGCAPARARCTRGRAAPALRARGAGCAGSSTAVKITAGTPQPKNKKTYFSLYVYHRAYTEHNQSSWMLVRSRNLSNGASMRSKVNALIKRSHK